MSHSAQDVLDEYLLYNDLEATTEKYYRRVVSAYTAWSLNHHERSPFTPRNASAFLRDKQAAGVSPWYLKSLRGGLRALLNFSGQEEKLRRVKVTPLDPEAWSASDVAKLIEQVPRVIMAHKLTDAAHDRRWYWRTVIPAAWYTGLSQGDLFALDRFRIEADGRIILNRSRTGKEAIVWIPPELIEAIGNRTGMIWRPRTSPEYFRREFERITTAAGLSGTFKKLRKSSGTAAEIANPGHGHEHLANTRKVFEQHYLSRHAIHRQPVRLPSIAPAS